MNENTIEYWIRKYLNEKVKWPNTVKYTKEDYIKVISKNTYNIRIELKIVSATLAKLHKKIFPNKPNKSSIKAHRYILEFYNKNYCGKCKKSFRF